MSGAADFVRRCIEERKSRGMTQADLASAWGKHCSAVNRVENGVSRLTLEDAFTWSAVLGVPLDGTSPSAGAFDAGRAFERDRMRRLLNEAA